MEDQTTGYSGELKQLFEAHSVFVGDRIVVETPDREFEGLLMPKHELSAPGHIVIKLDNGYNIGIRLSSGTSITKVEGGNPR